LRTLQQVALIAAEDTRHTRKLLTHFNIHNRLTSFFDHNEQYKLDEVLQTLETGDVALVSDAGTPGLNDPGYRLVQAALAAGHRVSPIPGPSAPIAALVSSGLPTDAFLFLGYLPRKSGERRRFLQAVAPLSYTLLFFEAPHRLLPALADLHQELGNRQIAVACELTKLYEEIFRGSLEEAQVYFAGQGPRGEYTLVVAGHTAPPEPWSESRLLAAIQDGLQSGASPSSLARTLASQSGWPRRAVYQRINAAKTSKPDPTDS
jgi:16S rRNA (cytidine1402-2'-O)-methyltransferase